MLPVLRICLRLRSLLRECSNRSYRALTKRSKGSCSKCGVKCPCYDHAGVRRFESIPFWGFLIFFVYNMRRVSCKDHGVTIEAVPWGEGKNQLTCAYMQFLAHWAKKLSWLDVGAPLLQWVKPGITRAEHNESALPPTADVVNCRCCGPSENT